MKSLMVVEFSGEGHAALYLCHFLRTVEAEFPDIEIRAFFPEPDRLKSLLPNKIRSEVLPLPWPPTRYMGVVQRVWEVGRRWRWIKREANMFRSSRKVMTPGVFFMQLDQMICAFYLSGVFARLWCSGWQFGGLYFRHFPFRRKLNTLKLKLLLDHRDLLNRPQLKTIGHFDENRLEEVARNSFGRVFWVPDVVVNSHIERDRDSSLVQKIRSKASGRKIILSVGLQDRRKGILELMRLVDKPKLKDYFFVFVGRLALTSFKGEELREIRLLLANDSQSKFIHPEFVEDEEELNAVVAESDLVYAVYRDFPFTSGVVGKSCILGKPILVADGGLMAERVSKYGLGVVVSSENPNHLQEILENDEWDQYPSAEGTKNYQNLYNDMETFDQVCIQMVESILEMR